MGLMGLMGLICNPQQISIMLMTSWLYWQVDNQDLVIHCEKLEGKLAQLDKIRQKQAKKITSLKDEMGVSDAGSEERLGKAEHAIQALSSELKTTKNLLDDTGKRERQVRQSISLTAFIMLINMILIRRNFGWQEV